MSAESFLEDALKLHADATLNPQGFVEFKYEIPVGGKIGEIVSLALQPPGDWPLSCPPGPHVSPALGHPQGAVHGSPLGSDWQYWSRPFQNWPSTDRSFATYMAHVRTLFFQLP
jgi:hypothetical protein